MTAFRQAVLRRPLAAACLLALALLMKLAVPAGYMVGHSAAGPTIELCTGYGVQTMASSMPGMAHHGDGQGQSGKAETPCAFAGLTAPSLAGADPLLLADAMLFVLRSALRIATEPAGAPAPRHLRPPLRGPPARP